MRTTLDLDEALLKKTRKRAVENGKTLPTSARFQLVSDGSALMAWLNEGIADEMVTMFHMDGKALMATHYCAAHNQPRMVLVLGGDPNKLVFKFKDGTNIEPGAGRMNQVTLVIDAPDDHAEEWVYLDKGSETTAHFDFNASCNVWLIDGTMRRPPLLFLPQIDTDLHRSERTPFFSPTV